jgi:N-acylglucosamine 2-epimerase/mannose-6-phosphate isomerase
MTPALSLKIHNWMFQDALPFWALYGVDTQNGGPVEDLELSGLGPKSTPFKRTRVAARQLYVFAHAALLGWQDGARVADIMYTHLTQKCWRGPEVGWVRTTTLAGEVLDPTPDLYDYAFALFGLGWYHKLNAKPEALALAHQTLDLIEAHFVHPQGGFLHARPAPLPRQQNPHMHLFEAALVLFETSGDARFGALATKIRNLFVTRFFQKDTGVLPEFFDEGLSPISGEVGRIVEPGHHFEWAWILGQHQKLTQIDNIAHIDALIRFGEMWGVDTNTAMTRNRIRDDGMILDGGSRTWPNTERLKGAIAWQEFCGKDCGTVVAHTTQCLFDWHLKHDIPGCWRDAFDAQGLCVAQAVPASTLYHVFLAFAEVLRLFPAVVQADPKTNL